MSSTPTPTFFDLDGILILGNAVIGGLIYWMSKSGQDTITNLKKAPSVEVGSSELDRLLSKTESPNQSLDYAALRGKVQVLRNAEPLESQGVKGVLKAVTVNEHSMKRYSTGFWATSVREIMHTTTEVPFGLTSLDNSSNIIVEVVDPSYAEHLDLFVPVDTKFDHVSGGFANTVLGYITGSRATGVETTSLLLPVGTNITAIGKVTKSANGSLRILNTDVEDFPYILSSHSVPFIVDRLESRSKHLKRISWVFFGLGLVLLTHKSWKLYQMYKWKKMRERILRERAEREIERRAQNPQLQGLEGEEGVVGDLISNEDRNGNQDNTLVCIVCLVNPRELILMPCGHVALCVNCLDRLNRICPVCRNPISSTHVAYIA